MPGSWEDIKISDFSSFARVIDPRYPTNLAILVIAFLSSGGLFAFSLVAGASLIPAVTAAFILGVSVFLTWAVGREIDPEHELASFVGLFLIIPGYWFLGAPELIMVLTMLLLLRMLNRSTGLPPKLLDSISIILLGSLLILRGEWIFGFLCAAAFLLDSRLADSIKRHLLFAGIMAALTIAGLFISKPEFPKFEFTPGQLIFVIVSVLLYFPLVLHSRNVDVICDFQPERLNPIRVQIGQIFAISSVVLVWLFAATPGITSIFPLWGSILGVSIAYLLTTLISKIRMFPGNP